MVAEEKQQHCNVDGYEVLTTALRDLVNRYPGLADSEEITFAVLDQNNRIAMFPVSGAVLETETNTVTGRVIQVCLYPFYVVYRVADLSENNKAAVKEWLDNLGKWLERQTVTINDTKHRLDEYPVLTGQKKLLSIARVTSGYLDKTNEDNTEDWVIQLRAQYQNEFQK